MKINDFRFGVDKLLKTSMSGERRSEIVDQKSEIRYYPNQPSRSKLRY